MHRISPVNLSYTPLSNMVLNAKRFRWHLRLRERFLLTVALFMLCLAFIGAVIAVPDGDVRTFSVVMAVLTSLLFLCAVPVLVMTYAHKMALQPATALQLLALSTEMPLLPTLSRYMAAVEAQKRPLTRAEASAILYCSFKKAIAP